ncbi:S-adenosyl-L-methionine-dependent methyltransferase [Bombardia bombarda]|uniref:S-adenosyl-L-methionine-dependent methyltransferase n=1 Tax=Bombardia bombarda TaxID=252184 RepID=A0AA39XKX7_9PEZI|nr:S-adenosyl-L-methionine-dependent methyltransferase [Bombardia bombarda]
MPPPTTPPPAPLSEILLSLIFPWRFILISLSFLPATIRSLPLSSLLSWPALQSAWFSRFWAVAGPQVREGAEPRVVPLLEGRVSNGRVVERGAAHVPGVGGTVLEIGPGSGMWVSIFSDRYLDSSTSAVATGASSTSGASTTNKTTTPAVGSRSRVTRVYGVEPNKGVHPLLRAQIAAAGLEDVYEVVPVGIEDLASSGRVAPESVDCIVSVLCLCSIPEPRRNIKELYGYLKPGGRWFVYEHVVRPPSQGLFMSLYQRFVNIFWPHAIGGCNIQRDTETWLREAGPWSDIDLVHPPDEVWFHTLPHVIGILTK